MGLHRIASYWEKARKTPFSALYRRIPRVLHREGKNVAKRVRAMLASTYCQKPKTLETYFTPLSPSQFSLGHCEALAQSVLNHHFDLLGSGPTFVKYGSQAKGVENHCFPAVPSPKFDRDGDWLTDRTHFTNRDYARRIWKKVGPNYQPIDWQLDFKSGFRWNEKSWSFDIPISPCPGADIKVPWELARMQHLASLAWAFLHARNEIYVEEFKNQILDFIATNPPGFGVNWSCAMDVAIRAANWLIIRDLLVAAGAKLDAEFESILGSSIVDHGRHIIRNLENPPGAPTNNHYLADVIGLFFIAGYLPAESETTQWLEFADLQIQTETKKQFLADGGNFESSTCYHRLSLEMLIYATAFAGALARKGRYRSKLISPEYIRNLDQMALLTLHLTKPFSATVPQIGDNDSGRFLKLWPIENDLDHRHLLDAIQALSARADFAGISNSTLERTLLSHWLGPDFSRITPTQASPASSHGEWIEWTQRIEALPEEQKNRGYIELRNETLDEPLSIHHYPDFGVTIFRNSRFFLCVRCGSQSQAAYNGHAHNDQLTLELAVDGQDWIRDPGTFLYTPSPQSRNQYRSVRAHFAPQFSDHREPSSLESGLFSLGKDPQGETHYYGPHGFVGAHSGYGIKVFRQVKFLNNRLEIVDFTLSKPPAPWAQLPHHLTSPISPETIAFSPAYGRKEFR